MKPVLLLVLGVASIFADQYPTEKIDNEVLEKLINAAETSRIVNDFIKGNNKFAVDLYKQLLKSNAKESFVVSPLLAELTLATVHHSTQGKTAQELSSGLHLINSKQDIRKSLDNLNTYLNKIFDRLNYKIYASNKYEFPDEFKSSVDILNFANKRTAIAEMNKWAEERTYNKIRDIIYENDLDENTSAMLLNAMYFNEVWEQEFPAEGTEMFPFYPDMNTEINITTMEQLANLNYCEELDAEIIELPYHQANNITLTIAVPDRMETLDYLENHLSELFAEHTYKKRLVQVKLPKLQIQSRIYFKPIMEALGVHEAFSDNADFKDIEKKFKINGFIQKTAFKVEEEGATEGTLPLTTPLVYDAKTGTNMETVYADHPFIFYVKVQNVILLVGRYTGP